MLSYKQTEALLLLSILSLFLTKLKQPEENCALTWRSRTGHRNYQIILWKKHANLAIYKWRKRMASSLYKDFKQEDVCPQTLSWKEERTLSEHTKIL